jgi:hypothetical protein
MGVTIIIAITFYGGPSGYILMQTLLLILMPRKHPVKQGM